jgi:chromosome segregation ATPase
MAMEEIKKDRYSVEEIKLRISPLTFKGMTKNIDDLAAFGRVLSIKDDADEEQFNKIMSLLDNQRIATDAVLETIKAIRREILDLKIDVLDLKKDIKDLKQDVTGLKIRVGEITDVVDCTRNEIKILTKDVEQLKKLNSTLAYVIRIGIGIAAGLGILWLWHGPF